MNPVVVEMDPARLAMMVEVLMDTVADQKAQIANLRRDNATLAEMLYKQRKESGQSPTFAEAMATHV